MTTGSVSGSPVDRLLRESSARWVASAPADEIVPYYRAWLVAPVLDAIYVGVTLLANLDDLSALTDIKSVSERFFRVPLKPRSGPFLPLSPEAALSPSHVDAESHAFRVFDYDQPTLYALDAGLRLARISFVEMSPREQFDVKRVRWQTAIAGSARFLQDSIRAHHSAGAFPATGYSGGPTLFGTFSATSGFESYAALSAVLDDLPSIEFPFNRVAESLLSEEFVVEDGDTFAFRRPGAAVGCVSSTLYAYRIWTMLGLLLGKRHNLYLELGLKLLRKAAKVNRFLQSCVDPKTGGFKAHPDEISQANLGHTRYALQVVRTMLNAGHVSGDELDWLDLATVARFVYSCWVEAPAVTGFDVLPGGKLPALCSQRAGVNSVKLLELFRLHGDRPVASEYFDLRDILLSRLQTIPDFIQSCLRSDGRCYAYPDRILREATDLVRENWDDDPSMKASKSLDSSRSPSTEMAWIRRQLPQLRKQYAGRWISLVGTTLVAVARTENDVLRESLQSGHANVFTFRIPTTEGEPIPAFLT